MSRNTGFALILALLAIGLAFASRASILVAGTVALYCVVAVCYTVFIKRLIFLDVVTLVGLYLLRIIGGAQAASVIPSHWLLAFAVLAFTSIALS